MAPDVVARKLRYIRRLLADLAPYENATLTAVENEHYKIERLLELLVVAASDILFHLLAQKGHSPGSYREAFQLAADEQMLPKELAERLQDAAGMRNILVHLYEQIDFGILRRSIKPALEDFNQFVAIISGLESL